MFEKVIRRISRILALIALYVMCAYGYLTGKGFVLKDNTFVLSNPAYAEDQPFAQPVAGDIGLSAERTRSLGSISAPLTMFVFSSLSCSHCRDFHKFTLPKIERDFIATGKLRFVYIHFPVEPIVMRAAKLSLCLPKEKFYDFLSELYDARDWLYNKDETKLYEHAKKFGMTDADIELCNEDKKLTSDILLVEENAIKTFKVKGTPSFIVTGKDGQELIYGTKSYDEFKKYFEKRLSGE